MKQDPIELGRRIAKLIVELCEADPEDLGFVIQGMQVERELLASARRRSRGMLVMKNPKKEVG